MGRLYCNCVALLQSFPQKTLPAPGPKAHLPAPRRRQLHQSTPFPYAPGHRTGARCGILPGCLRSRHRDGCSSPGADAPDRSGHAGRPTLMTAAGQPGISLAVRGGAPDRVGTSSAPRLQAGGGHGVPCPYKEFGEG